MIETQKTEESAVTFYKLFWTFFLVSIFGYVFEVIVHFLRSGGFENHQGLIYGPFSQVYGVGAGILVLIYPKLYNKKNSFVYVVCVLGGGIFEYICSLIQETFFGGTSWDYSHMKFNFQGRTNLTYAFIWGVFGILIIKFIYPKLSGLLDRVPTKKLLFITCIVFILMTANALLTSIAVRRQYERHNKIPATNKLQIFLDKKYPDSYLKKLSPEPNFK